MAFVLILLGALAVWAIASTIVHLRRDGYGRRARTLPPAKQWSDFIR